MNAKIKYAVVISSIIVIFFSGIFFGMAYFFMDNVETALTGLNCQLPDTMYGNSCSDYINRFVMPIFVFKDLIQFLFMCFVFGTIISCLTVGYFAGTSGIYLALDIIFVGCMTYGAILLRNIGVDLFSNTAMQSLLAGVPMYYNIVDNLHIIAFVVALVSVGLGTVNFIRNKTNKVTDEELMNY